MSRYYRSLGSPMLGITSTLILVMGCAHLAMAQNKPESPLDSLPPEKRQAVETAFKVGSEEFQQNHYDKALIEYKKVLAIMPDDISILWNCGTASFFAKEYPFSLQCWQRLRVLIPQVIGAPQEGDTFTVAKVTGKMIQVYQAMGDKAGRDKERAVLVQMRKSHTDPSLTKKKSFCCDQFTVEGKSVLAYDYFALTGKFGVRYDFVVTKPDGKMDYHIELECSPDDNSLAHTMKEIKPNERLFSLDGLYEEGRFHRTFGFLKASASKLPADATAAEPAPSYETVKSLVIQIIQGKIKSQSSSSAGKP